MKKVLSKIIVALLTFSLLSVPLITNAIAEDNILHPATLVWDDPETINEYLEDDDDSVDNASPIPNSVDLTSKFPAPGDQMNSNSCVGWAVGYSLKSSQENSKRDWQINTNKHNFSPSFIFNQLTSGGNGITISSAMNLCVNTGICSMEYFPYNAEDYTTQPSSKTRAAASLYKSSHWKIIKGIITIKNHLAEGDGVVIGVKVYPDFDQISNSNPIYDNKSGSSRGGHAICLIGYDDSKNAFKFINSWGTSWGLNGYGWISYDLVNDVTVNHHGAAVGYVMEPATDDYFLGDVNGDGRIDSEDSLMIIQHAANLITLTDRQCALADVNGDTFVTADDSNYILKYAANLIPNLPLYD